MYLFYFTLHVCLMLLGWTICYLMIFDAIWMIFDVICVHIVVLYCLYYCVYCCCKRNKKMEPKKIWALPYQSRGQSPQHRPLAGPNGRPKPTAPLGLALPWTK